MIDPHYREEDIQMLFFNEDINRWSDEADLINDEIRFYNSSFILDYFEKIPIEHHKLQKLYSDLIDFEIKHQTLIVELEQFRYLTKGIRECDDLACENTYMNSTAVFKIKQERHIGEFRKLKKEILKCLKYGLQHDKE